MNCFLIESIVTFIVVYIILHDISLVYIAILFVVLIGIFKLDINSIHGNPIFTLMQCVKGNLENNQIAGYIGAQIIGTYAAYKLYKLKNKK